MNSMKAIVTVVFLFTIVPYLGLPRLYDVWIVLLLVALFVYLLFRYVQTHDIRIKLPKNLEDDFFEQNKEDISPELGQDTIEKQ
jgi:Ca2+/Na+ antiporter